MIVYITTATTSNFNKLLSNYVKYKVFRSDRSMNRKRKMFKIFKVEPRLNRDDVIINLNINKYIKLIKIKKLPKIVPNS